MEMKLLSVTEMADRLSCDAATVRRACVDGRLPAYKLFKQWKVDEEDFERWLASRKSQIDFEPLPAKKPERRFAEVVDLDSRRPNGDAA